MLQLFLKHRSTLPKNMNIHHLEGIEGFKFLLDDVCSYWSHVWSHVVGFGVAPKVFCCVSWQHCLLIYGTAVCFTHAQTEKSERNPGKSLHALRNLILKSSSLYQIS